MRRLLPFLLALGAGCQTVEEPGARRPAAPEFDGMTLVEDAPVHHLLHASERIWSGAAPERDEDFAALAELGVRTIVNVDGARPDVAAAARHGMRTVHVPIGYDAIPGEAALAIARVMQETEGPVYFHCHHGVHRGPAAAAIALKVETGCDAAQAEALLRLAQTDPNYHGLWRDVAAFSPPAPGTPLPELHEISRVEDFVAAMAAMDRDWDRVKAVREAAWRAPPEHPDLAPAKEARILAERFSALDSLLPSPEREDARFARWLREGQAASQALQAALDRGDAAAAQEAFGAVKQSCSDCHKVFRNG